MGEERSSEGIAGGTVDADGADLLLERERELSQIADLIADAERGSGRVLVVQGAAGIGKTALLRAGAARARARGLATLAAHGAELEQTFPYAVVRQLLEPSLSALDGPARDRVVDGAAALAASALSPGASPLPAPQTLDPSSAVLHGLYSLSVNLSARGPIVMVVDDAHWSDPASLHFLAYLARRLEGLPVSLLVAIREGDPGEWAAELEGLRDVPAARVLQLAGLSVSSVGMLLERAGGRVPDEQLAAAVHKATGGNPFLAHELAAALEADGAPLTREAVDQVGTLGPRTVSRSIMVRAARVGAEAGPVLRAVAVLGDQAELRHVAALASVEQGVAASVAGELARHGVLDDCLPLAFAHPVLRSTVYADMTAAERVDWHARAAALLEAVDANVDVVAGHLLRTEPSGADDVVSRMRRAAGAALAGGAGETAVRYLRRALSEPVQEAERPALLHELATAETLVRDPAAVAHLQEAYALTSDPLLRARYAYELANLFQYVGNWSDAVELLIAAIDELGDRDEATLLRLTALLVTATLDPQHVADLDARMPEFLRLADSSTPEARPLRLHLALTLACRGDRCELVPALVTAGLDDGALIADEGPDSLAAAQAVHALVAVDELEPARDVAETLMTAARDTGSVLGFVAGAGLRALIATKTGALIDAEADARPAVELAQQHGLFLIAPFVASYLIEVLIERGGLDEAGRLVAAVGLPDQFVRMPQAARLAESAARLHEVQGERDRALERWREAGQIWDACGTYNPNISNWRSELALLLAPDDPAAARALVDDELARARRAKSLRAVGIALRARGLVLGGEDGLNALAAGATELERTHAGLEHARALIELGAALRRANRRVEAREPLRAARELAHGCGALRLAERAETELRATGARPRRLALSGFDALTPSERRVARLAADGITSRQIAQQLFVTVNTVDSHLRHAYRKLDVHSREELARALAER